MSQRATKTRHPIQFAFKTLEQSYRENQCGGSRVHSHPKAKRALDRKRPIHVVLKSSKAKGPWSLLLPKNRKAIDRICSGLNRKFGVKEYGRVNVGNHIHLVVRIHDRQNFAHYLRALSGLIARQVTGAQRGCAFDGTCVGTSKGTDKNTPRFWDARPFTRLMTWGREYRTVKKYLARNHIQAVGFDDEVLFGLPEVLKLAG